MAAPVESPSAQPDLAVPFHTINGRPETSEEQSEIIDPATGEVFAQCPLATGEQLDRAVAAAQDASPAWAQTGWAARSRALTALAEAIRAETEPLAHLLTREQGKPLAHARAEILRCAEIFAQVAAYSEITAVVLREDETAVVEQHFAPRGPTAVITPWNVPVGIAALRSAPFLQTGNTVVLKPSPYTPLTTLRLGRIAARVLPAGVFNVLSTGDALAGRLTAHEDIAAVSFTGSVPTGRSVMASAAPGLKHLGLELGGNDPAIVLDDVDPQAVAPQIFRAAFANSGQICMAIKRVYAHESIHDRLVEELARLADAAVLGPGTNPRSEIGPVQNQAQHQRLRELLEETRAIPGVRLATARRDVPERGYFLAPTVVADIRDGARLVDEEQFGPVLPVVRFTDEDDALHRANATRYGLSASVWSASPGRAAALAQRVEAGTVWINTHLVTDVHTPFGGWKDSGIGRVNGVRGLESCLEGRVVFRAKQPARRPAGESRPCTRTGSRT
ncbi:aldehyde dehydrogenase [Streptomyces albus]|uniref:Aldehyde dehydrogenase n=1 Tax=Streptomyces albus (strain ATCC 21838 / DSM 41398 / FERM P-419 / JCM 4703 / NBRC 107858) TaxID=1081613 RepID=A0A0B5EM33_STRA4|nr:aldehyde dehydrogenase [Streptomyces albus]AOU74720.1 aldehyde dehydrogenase [Streptomyces albus]AYN30530.1 aldehyde dehydrogenase (NAD+) [Streptomyces albus]